MAVDRIAISGSCCLLQLLLLFAAAAALNRFD